MIIKMFIVALIIAFVVSMIWGKFVHKSGKKFLGIFYNYPEPEENKNEEKENNE